MHRASWLYLGALRGLTAAIVLWFFALPGIVVVLSALASDWLATVFPSSFTLRWFKQLDATDLNAIVTSWNCRRRPLGNRGVLASPLAAGR
jgi:ABC-type spermidine/putrescine transport system permease subunit II